MVDSSRRRGRRDVMGSHNRCWIWGRNVVVETARAGRWPILELMLGDRTDAALQNEIRQLARRHRFPVTISEDAQLTKVCRTAEHQGFAARMAPFPYQSGDELMQATPDDAIVAVLDRLQDPFNFGAIIRSASMLGIRGILVEDREQVEINSQVARSSAGAVNHLPIARTADLESAVDRWRDRGFQVVGASEKGVSPPYRADFARGSLIVIGNEGRGIRAGLLSRCDVCVSIPTTGRVGSLNAAVAAGILFYETRRQRSLPPAQGH